jgi:hypothetical protein
MTIQQELFHNVYVVYIQIKIKYMCTKIMQ